MLSLHIQGKTNQTVDVAKDEFIIGRLPECDLCLPFPEVSRSHTCIKKIGGGEWAVEDLNSVNGTILNRFRLNSDSPQNVTHGDVIQIGNVVIIVYLPQQAAKETLPLPPGSQRRTILRNAEELQQQWIKADRDKSIQDNQKQAIARLKDLVEIAKGLNSAESIDAIFQQVQKVVFRELKDIGRLALLVDVRSTGDLSIIDAATRAPTLDRDFKKDSNWISRSICKKVFAQKVAIKTVDAQTDKRFEGENSILANGIRGALAVPLWDEKEVVGVLYADAHLRLTESDKLDEDDLSFFSALANLVASSVQRWLLTRKLQGEAQIRQQLERYHSPAVVQQLLSVGAIEHGRIKPKEADITILFADLVGFSALSERLSPAEIAELLNRFFEEMLQPIFKYGGTLDKFIGDCIMAFFGAPEPQADHADRAVSATMEMLNHLDQLNSKKTWNHPLELRVAINSGKAVVGDVGSSQRVDYTVLGGAVNLASRMEAVCPPGECVVSEATYKELKDASIFTESKMHRFKGFDRQVNVYRTQRKPDQTT
ncbi:MAG: adenylate/guanylate cyclase domain-containing protein [Spirulinaceae cyanobacterium]